MSQNKQAPLNVNMLHLSLKKHTISVWVISQNIPVFPFRQDHSSTVDEKHFCCSYRKWWIAVTLPNPAQNNANPEQSQKP